jgi:hypothetical protein
MVKQHKILVIWSGPSNGTSANLFKELVKGLQTRHIVHTAPNGTVPGSRAKKILNHILCDLRRWPKVFSSDTVILHSYSALSLPTVLLARLLNRRIVVIQWDTYPITVDGKTLGGFYRKTFDRLELFLVGISTRIVIPSEDFRAFVRHHDMSVMPLWPSVPLGRVSVRAVPAEGQQIRLAFVGQAGLTRGLPQAVARLGRETSARLELHIFSPKPPEEGLSDIAPNVRVVPRGYLGRSELLSALEEMDFGLISLHPGMGQPGFPSKTFDYVAAGLPVVYTGRPLPAFAALLERTGVGFALGGAAVDWPTTLQKTKSSMPEAVRAFAAETELNPETLDRVIF